MKGLLHTIDAVEAVEHCSAAKKRFKSRTSSVRDQNEQHVQLQGKGG